MRIVPLLNTTIPLETLAAGLRIHLAASGLTLREDHDILDHLAFAARTQNVNVVLATMRDQALGIAAWHRRDSNGFIQLLYVLPDAPESVAHDLLKHMMANLTSEPGLTEIFVELTEALPPVQSALFAAGFVGAERRIMRVELASRRWLPVLAVDYHLRLWDDVYVDEVGELIYLANVGMTDAQIIPELRTVDLTRDVVCQTLAGRYGDFDGEASGVVIANDGQIVGVTLATRRSRNTGFTAEICVRPDHRRRGLARTLMQRTHAAFYDAGLGEGLLGVTAGNLAYHLYESLGYRTIGIVWSYVWPQPAGWRVAR